MTKTALAMDPGGSTESHLRALREVALARQDLERTEHFHVMSARAAGHSWHAIASALGVSKQAAHRRFRSKRHEN